MKLCCVLVIGRETSLLCHVMAGVVARSCGWPYKPLIPCEFARAVADTEGPVLRHVMAGVADNDVLNGPSLALWVLDPHLGSGMKSLFGLGAIDSPCDSGLLTPPLLQMLLELFICLIRSMAYLISRLMAG